MIGVFMKLTLGLLLVGCSSLPGVRLGQRREPEVATEKAEAKPSAWASLTERFHRKKNLDPLAALEADAKGEERIDAYRELGDLKLTGESRSKAQQFLINGALSEYNVLARAAAVSSLKSYEDPEVTETLLRATEDKSHIVRIEACKSLEGRTDENVVKTVRKMATGDMDPDVRIAATRTLAATKDPSVVNALVDCLKDDELSVAKTAANGLRDITGADIQNAKHQEWKSWVDSHPDLKDVQHTASKKSGTSHLLDVFRR